MIKTKKIDIPLQHRIRDHSFNTATITHDQQSVCYS